MKSKLHFLLIVVGFTAASLQSCHILRGKNKCDDCPHWSKTDSANQFEKTEKNTFAGAPNSITFDR